MATLDHIMLFLLVMIFIMLLAQGMRQLHNYMLASQNGDSHSPATREHIAAVMKAYQEENDAIRDRLMKELRDVHMERFNAIILEIRALSGKLHVMGEMLTLVKQSVQFIEKIENARIGKLDEIRDKMRDS